MFGKHMSGMLRSGMVDLEVAVDTRSSLQSQGYPHPPTPPGEPGRSAYQRHFCAVGGGGVMGKGWGPRGCNPHKAPADGRLDTFLRSGLQVFSLLCAPELCLPRMAGGGRDK